MTNSIREKMIDFAAMIRSEPFQCGVADILTGTWTEWGGYVWDGFAADAIYETGRLASAAIGRPCRTFTDYMQACDVRAFPPNAPRAANAGADSPLSEQLLEQFYAGLGRKMRR